MKTDELKAWGLTDEQSEKVMAQYGKDVSKLQKENEKLTADRDKEKERADTAEETLKKFDGVDLEGMKAEVDKWKLEAEKTKTEYERKEAEREFEDILKTAISEAKGRNEKAIRANLDIEKLMKSRNQREDVKKALEDLKGAEDTAFMFVDEKQEQLEAGRAKPFTGPLKGAAQPTTSEKFKAMSLDERIKLKASDPAAYERMRKGE